MKLLMKFLPALMLALFVSSNLSSQQMFAIHEDRVYPGAIAQYEKTSKDLIANMKKHSVTGADFLTLMLDDFRYIYISPVENMAALDKNPFAALDEKMGKEAAQKMWAGFEKCYDEHGDYMITLDAELSYQPSGINNNPEGEYYRTLDYWYVTEANESALREVAKSIKKLYADAGSDFYYRVYRSGFGTMGPFYMVASAAKSPQALQDKQDRVAKATGEKRQMLLSKALGLTRKYETMNGWIRPDLSYMSEN